jgi:hypothetical protein
VFLGEKSSEAVSAETKQRALRVGMQVDPNNPVRDDMVIWVDDYMSQLASKKQRATAVPADVPMGIRTQVRLVGWAQEVAG